MDFVFKCPQCDQALEVDSSGVGTDIVCPSCNHVIVVPPPGTPAGKVSAHFTPAKSEGLLSLASAPKSAPGLIQKPSRPLEVAAKVGDKKFHIKTIRHADCVQNGKDNFDSVVSEFLEKFTEQQVVSISPVSYSHAGGAPIQALMDYGVIVVYKS